MGNRAPKRYPPPSELSSQEIDSLKSVLHLTDDKIEHMRAKFHQDNPSGRLDRAGFLRYLDRLEPDHCYPNDITNEIFVHFDQNQDGRIDFREYMLGLLYAPRRGLDATLDTMFSHLDTSQDDYLNFDELVAFLIKLNKLNGDHDSANANATRPTARKVFKVFGVSESDKISRSHFIARCKSNRELRNIFGGVY